MMSLPTQLLSGQLWGEKGKLPLGYIGAKKMMGLHAMRNLVSGPDFFWGGGNGPLWHLWCCPLYSYSLDMNTKCPRLLLTSDLTFS